MNAGVIVVTIMVIFGVAAFGWWLLIHTEGVYLGQRVVIWLYDLYARRYDAIKSNDDTDEHLYLAQPLLNALAGHTDPLVLDVAAGTGRMALALCQHARFDGFVLGTDLSAAMLKVAADKLADNHFDDMAAFVLMSADQLHVESSAFDVVTCMEALEFLPSRERTLREIARVLRPGGLLLTTLRQHAPTVPNVWTQAQMQAALQQAGFEAIEFVRWQQDYQLVWAQRLGSSPFLGAQPYEHVLRCAVCQHVGLLPSSDDDWQCPQCQQRYTHVNGMLDMRQVMST